VAEPRDHYLPVRKDDILSALAQERACADPAGGAKSRRLCEMLGCDLSLLNISKCSSGCGATIIISIRRWRNVENR
jgi:hypothetical protein